MLALLAWQAPNVLLLDEPTNHLDLDMRHALTMALAAFEGAVITVSHDRHLLENTVNDYLLVANGQVREFNGNLNDYRKWLDRERLEAKNDRTNDREPAQPLDRKAARKAAADERAALQPLRNRSKKLMSEIDAKSRELQALESALADPGLYEAGNRSRLETLLKQQATLRKDMQALEAAWTEVEEAIEAGSAQ